MEPKIPCSTGIFSLQKLSDEEVYSKLKEADEKKLWNLAATGVYEARKYSDGEGVSIVLLNSGVDYEHPEIKSCFNENLKGKNFVYWKYDERGKPIPDNNQYANKVCDYSGHGTLNAGIIASKSFGIAPKVKLYSLKIADEHGKIDEMETLEESLNWCLEKRDMLGLDIINMSLGFSYTEFFRSDEIANKFQEILNRGIFVVASIGNGGTLGPTYPACLDDIISVGSVNINLEHSGFSEVNHKLKICALGEEQINDFPEKGIFSLNKTGDQSELPYASCCGTSVATPHVTGILALGLSYLKKQERKYSREEVQQILLNSAKAIPTTAQALKDIARKLCLYDIKLRIRPEEIKKMVFGRGLVHAENFLKELRKNLSQRRG
jgi:major intracellular serine protease